MKRFALGALALLLSGPLLAMDVWYSESPDHSNQVAEAAAKLAGSLGGTATPFDSETSNHEWDDALANADVILIGQSGVDSDVDGSTRTDIGTWIDAGGVLVTLRDSNSLGLLNDTMGTSFTIGAQKSSGGSAGIRQPVADGSSFDLAPVTLVSGSDHQTVSGGYEPDTVVAYVDTNTQGDVLIQPYGDGSGIYFSWDWCCSMSDEDRAGWDSALLAAVTYPDDVAAVPDTAQFRVTKIWNPTTDMTVNVTLECNGGTDLVQTFPLDAGGQVTFTLEGITDESEITCNVTEETPSGWMAMYNMGDAMFDSESCEYVDVAADEVYRCQITNSPMPVEIIVNKEWEFENTNEDEVGEYYEIELHCETEILGGACGPGCGYYEGGWSLNAEGSGEDEFEFDVVPGYPKSKCRVMEYVYDMSVVSDNQCGEFEISIGTGYECTITNTAIYEGIPTLGQYGKALLALLMLGVGFVGLRRFA